MDVREKLSSKKRLIDVNKVINSVQKCLDESPDKKHSVAYFAFETIIECLKQEPTVDALEVVRCRVCKYHNKPPCPMRLSFNWTEDDDFCSYGERKEGAD